MSLRTRIRPRGFQVFIALLIAAAVCVVVAGCGGSGGSSDSTESGGETTESTGAGSDSAGVARAKAAVAKYEKPPTSIGITKPLKTKPATGKTIDMVVCNLPVCKIFITTGEEAAEALGWHVKAIYTTGTPEDINAKISQAVSEKPDGILTSGWNRSVYEEALKEAEAAEVPIVTSGTTDKTEPPFIANTVGIPVFVRNGEILGNFIVADSNGKANVAAFNIAEYVHLRALAEAIESTIEKQCSECGAKVVEQQLTDIGTDLPSNVVSTLQADPSINYLAFTDGNFSSGVVAALREAGLSEKVKIVLEDPTEANFPEILAGNEYAGLAYSQPWVVWTGFDSFARYFEGEDAQNPPLAMPTQILTKSNLEAALEGATNTWSPPNMQQQFKELWHVE